MTTGATVRLLAVAHDEASRDALAASDFAIALQVLLRRREVAGALEIVPYALAAAPGNVTILTLAYDAFLAAGRAAEAVRYLAPASVAGGNDPRVLIRMLARAAEPPSRNDGVIDVLVRRLRQRAGDRLDAHLAIARALLTCGEKTAAIHELETFLADSPLHADGWAAFGLLLDDCGEPVASAAAAERAAELRRIAGCFLRNDDGRVPV